LVGEERNERLTLRWMLEVVRTGSELSPMADQQCQTYISAAIMLVRNSMQSNMTLYIVDSEKTDFVFIVD
jgi:hypothetical protein